MKSIVSIILIGTSIAISVFYTNKNYIAIKEAQAESAELTRALEKSREVLKKRDDLTAEYKSFKAEDLANLNKTVPDSVDNIQLLLDIQNIADKKGMQITNTSIQSGEKTSKSETLGPSKETYSSISLSFKTKATYETFLDFLKKLQESMRIVDITALSFQSNDTGSYDYDITIRTYWLK